MEVLRHLFEGYPNLWGGGVAHSVLILSLVIAFGIMLGKIKIWGVSLGATWILFVGILFGHLNMNLDEHLLHFMKEFGLILFVYSIGLQVGPGFFSAFKKGGLTLNLLAIIVVVLGVGITVALHLITGLPITTMVGILSGAVTNTPGLGAAQQAYSDLSGIDAPEIALGYAVSYPLGVVGIILSLIALKYLLRINTGKEEKDAERGSGQLQELTVRPTSIEIRNEAVEGLSVKELHPLLNRKFVISRIKHREGGETGLVNSDTTLHVGDKILVISTPADIEAITVFFGKEISMEWEQLNKELISRRILITKPELNGKTLSQLKIRNNFGASITRVNRSGVDLVATPQLQLQMGDRVTIVGTELAVSHTEKVLGNSLKRLNHPNLIPIFIGIALGCILGSIPFTFPGIPQPLKLGLAGGPLIVSILISRFGPKYKMITYTTMSANLMLREIGISIFLACVGLGAGKGFVETIIYEGGYTWIGYGVIITILPLLIAGWWEDTTSS
ncbi:glycoside hydrolase [Bacteroides pyogenes JCM 10003]|nr:glycoside hydrolase [Bacteroides pyogenes JCM 10003]